MLGLKTSPTDEHEQRKTHMHRVTDYTWRRNLSKMCVVADRP